MLRQSQREFAPTALAAALADLLWAAAGINRPELGGRTAPSALNAEVDVYAAMADGLYRYDPAAHAPQSPRADVRRVTGYQDFVDSAPLDLVYVADHARMKMVPAAQRRGLRLHGRRRDGAERLPRLRRAGPGAAVIRAWISTTRRARAGDGPGGRPTVAARADRGPAGGISDVGLRRTSLANTLHRRAPACAADIRPGAAACAPGAPSPASSGTASARRGRAR